jgi:hypothetical protein
MRQTFSLHRGKNFAKFDCFGIYKKELMFVFPNPPWADNFLPI